MDLSAKPLARCPGRHDVLEENDVSVSVSAKMTLLLVLVLVFSFLENDVGGKKMRKSFVPSIQELGKPRLARRPPFRDTQTRANEKSPGEV